jgi:hypothetical protein
MSNEEIKPLLGVIAFILALLWLAFSMGRSDD